MQMTDPSSRQREHPTSTSLQQSDSNKVVVLGLRWVLLSKTDLPTDRWSYHEFDLDFYLY
jgi:hypothetical protein